MFISRRCNLFRWSAVFRRCRRRRRLESSTGSQIATWKRSLTRTRHDFSHDLRPLLTGRCSSRWLPAFLTEPSSARYSSAPSITSVWSNYQTSYNDFFEVYITETVTLSPIVQNGVLTSSTFSMSITWPIVLRPHWSNRLQLIYRYDKSLVCKCTDISCWSPVKSIMYDRWQWLSFNAKLARNK